jgi:hypothetical protein
LAAIYDRERLRELDRPSMSRCNKDRSQLCLRSLSQSLSTLQACIIMQKHSSGHFGFWIADFGLNSQLRIRDPQSKIQIENPKCRSSP